MCMCIKIKCTKKWYQLRLFLQTNKMRKFVKHAIASQYIFLSQNCRLPIDDNNINNNNNNNNKKSVRCLHRSKHTCAHILWDKIPSHLNPPIPSIKSREMHSWSPRASYNVISKRREMHTWSPRASYNVISKCCIKKEDAWDLIMHCENKQIKSQ